MSSYLILLAGLLAIWYFAFRANGREIGSPASVVCILFAAVTVLCIYGYGKWNTVDLSIMTIAITWCGCAAFAFGCALAFHRQGKKQIRFETSSQNELPGQMDYRIDLWKMIALMAVFLLIAYVRVISMNRIAAESGANVKGIIQTSKWYREAFSRLFGSGTVRGDIGETTIEKQILRFATVITNASVVVFLIAFSRKDKRSMLASGFLLAIFTVYSILTDGGRAGVLFKVLMIAYGIYILQLRKGVPNRKLNRKFLILAAAAVLVLLPLFYFSSSLVGRKARGDILDYLSFYYGCGIPSLELKLQQGIGSQPVGQNVFYGIYTLLYKVGLTNQLNGYANDWQYLTTYKSNVYTAWYRYYADFGMVGVVLLAAFYGWFFTFLYQKIKKGNNLLPWCVFFAWGHSLFDLCRDDYLYGQFFGTAPLINLALSFLVLWFLCGSSRPDISFAPSSGMKTGLIEKAPKQPARKTYRSVLTFARREPIRFS